MKEITKLAKIGPLAVTVLMLALSGPKPASGQSITVTLLGTGNPRPVMSRFGPSILVEAGKEKLLFDCGRGSTQRLYQLKRDFSALTALFFTHLHSDHVVGFPDFWLTGWVMGRDTPLRVWGPIGTKAMTAHLAEAFSFDITTRRDLDERLPGAGVQLEARDIAEGVVYESNGVKVTAFNVDHGAVKPALGYRVDFGGHSVVLSGDTRYSENLIRFAQGTDVLVHEVIDVEAYHKSGTHFTPEQQEKVISHHTTPEQAGSLFSKVKPKLAVYSHIVPPEAPTLLQQTRKTYGGPLEVGVDLMRIEIGDKVSVLQPDK
jgi:ribonuclease Z